MKVQMLESKLFIGISRLDILSAATEIGRGKAAICTCKKNLKNLITVVFGSQKAIYETAGEYKQSAAV